MEKALEFTAPSKRENGVPKDLKRQSPTESSNENGTVTPLSQVKRTKLTDELRNGIATASDQPSRQKQLLESSKNFKSRQTRESSPESLSHAHPRPASWDEGESIPVKTFQPSTPPAGATRSKARQQPYCIDRWVFFPCI